MQFRVYDKTWAHQKNITYHWLSKKGIEWNREAENAHTVFFSDVYLSLVDSVKAERKVAILIEPPEIYSNHYSFIANNYKKFDHIITYSKGYLDFDSKRFLYYNNFFPWVPEEDHKIWPKSKMCSIVASHKMDTTGHRLRHQIINSFKDKFDIHGCGYTKFEYSKTNMYKDYMYSVAVMNCKFDDYLTEIVTDCFAVGTVPIFWGTQNIGKYFNPKGIIQFNSIEELNFILNNINEQDYYSRMDAIKENFQIATKYTTIEDYLFDTYPFLFDHPL